MSKDSQIHELSLAGIRCKTGSLPNLDFRFAQKIQNTEESEVLRWQI